MEKKNCAYIAIVFAIVLLAVVLTFANFDRRAIDEPLEEDRVYCTEEQRFAEVCPMVYEPVCGYKEDGTSETYGNDCEACKNPEVIYYVEGEC